MNLSRFFGIFVLLYLTPLLAYSATSSELRSIEGGDTEIDIRIFRSNGNVLLLGFPCDEGRSIAEEKTASSLAADGIEVWMPDLLSAYMLPKVKSSLASIQTEAIIALITEATKTGKQIYLIASGPDTELVLRGAREWEKLHPDTPLTGAILMFPRLFKDAPEPGVVPEYVDAVGQTKLPIMLLEGERTPNRWGIANLSDALQQNGSQVISKVIPNVRGYFFKRADANRSEDVVTSQLAGMIKVSLFYLQEEKK